MNYNANNLTLGISDNINNNSNNSSNYTNNNNNPSWSHGISHPVVVGILTLIFFGDVIGNIFTGIYGPPKPFQNL